MNILGIDIGGTNTDIVLVDENKHLIACHKTTTTDPVDEGFAKGISTILKEKNIHPDSIHHVVVGTTHAINALLQKNNLYKVGVLRIAGHRPDSLPPCTAWPKDMLEAIVVGHATIGGGHTCEGKPLSPFSIEEAKRELKELLQQAESLAITSVFSSINNEHEKLSFALAKDLGCPHITCSYEIGSIGFIERENATILNASLIKALKEGFSRLKIALESLGLFCPLFLTKNDGTLMPLEEALLYPLFTLSSGPTNSFMGAAKLANLDNAIVVDVGGTSTDVGIVLNGFPRRLANNTIIGGISLNFPYPDVLSIALGGGSHVKFLKDQILIGPKSSAKNLLKEAKSFGGEELTLTDCALAAESFAMKNSKKISLSKKEAKKVLSSAFTHIEKLVETIQGRHRDLPILLVGGGSSLFDKLPNRFFLPPFSDVANAYGAALAEISQTTDLTLSLTEREKTLEKLKEETIQKAIHAGASPKDTRIVDITITPYFYLPNHLARVSIKAAGPWSLNS